MSDEPPSGPGRGALIRGGPERLAADGLARALQGTGGAPGRPGVVHVVGVDGADPAGLSVRGAVLLRSATVVASAVAGGHPVLRLAGEARVLDLPVGPGAAPTLADLAAGGEVVVRLVPGPHPGEDGTLADEVAALEEKGASWEVDPVPAEGPLARFRDRLPLAGLTVLNPRTVEQAPALSMHVRSRGGTPLEAPTIAVREGDRGALDTAVRELAGGGFRALCLTSPNGVDAVAGAARRLGLDARALAGVDLVACVGPGTASRLAARLAVDADLVPDESTTAGLAAAFPAGPGRVLMPRADIATNELLEGLEAAGWTGVEVAAYRTVRPPALPPPATEALREGGVDLVALTSSSTARNLARLAGDGPWRDAVVTIGPVTSATCREHGIEPALQARRHDLEGLVAALCEAAEALLRG